MSDQTPRNPGLANLKPPWKSGETGNPKGRPKGRSITTLIREVLDQETITGLVIEDGKDVALTLAEAIVVHAINGNSAYMREVMDRIEGKIPSDLNIGNADRIIVEYIDAPIAAAMTKAGLEAMGLDTGPQDDDEPQTPRLEPPTKDSDRA